MSDSDEPPEPGLPVPQYPVRPEPSRRASGEGGADIRPSTGSGRTADNLPAPYRERHDGWTAARRGKFFRALAETGCVRDACRVAAISSTSAYRMRTRDPDFAAEWWRAQDEAQPQLEAAAWKRAVEGVEEPIVSGGRIIGQKRKYSDSLLRMLIQRGDLRDGLARQAGMLSFAEYRDGWRFDAEGRKVPGPSDDELIEEIDARLAEMKRRMEAEEGEV